MAFPEPVPGLVIRYSYLWMAEHKRGQEEGVKDRPCAIVLAATAKEGQDTVVVLPITHAAPEDLKYAIEIPSAVKRRLGLDDARSWVMVNEANRFSWPGPDLRPAIRGDASSVAYGHLPYRLYETIRASFVSALKERRANTIQRSE